MKMIWLFLVCAFVFVGGAFAQERVSTEQENAVALAIEKPGEVAFAVEGTEITMLEYVTGGDWRHVFEGMGDIATGGIMIAKGFASYNPVDVVVGIYDVGAGLHNTISGVINKNTRLTTVTLWGAFSSVGKLIDKRSLRDILYDR